MDKLVLTEEEERLTKYCEDFCPIYSAIEEHNSYSRHIIACPTEMCTAVTKSYILDRRERNGMEVNVKQAYE